MRPGACSAMSRPSLRPSQASISRTNGSFAPFIARVFKLNAEMTSSTGNLPKEPQRKTTTLSRQLARMCWCCVFFSPSAFYRAFAMANKMRMPISIPEFTIKDRESYSAGDSIRSPLSGPTDAFRFSLLIFPSGTEVSRTDRNQLRSFRPLSAFVEATPPQAMKDYSPENAGYEGWKCMNVRYSIMVRSQTARNSDLKFDDTFDFSEQQADRGWHDLFKNETHPRRRTELMATVWRLV